MRVCGIVAEYDPFHKGHAYQLLEAKLKSKADYVICVISTAFTQRGVPGLFSTRQRAEMALLAGADLVLGIPVSYSCAQSNRFAMGGIGILNALGVVTHLSFGIEENSLNYLHEIRDLLLNPNLPYQSNLKSSLSKGMSFARAQGEAINKQLPHITAKDLNKPNFNLAVSYLQTLSLLHSLIEPIPVIRRGNYHDTKITAFSSASAVRAAILRGDWPSVEEALPQTSFFVVKKAILYQHIHLPAALDRALLIKLTEEKDYSTVPEMSEGLDFRMMKYARQAKSRNHLIELMKTKRYPYTRISRALTQSMLGIKKQILQPPDYARLIGFRKNAGPLFQAIGQHGFPLVSRPARFMNSDLSLDMYAEQLWQIGSNQSSADVFRHKPVII